MSFRRRLLLTLPVLFAIGCVDHQSPTEPPETQAAVALAIRGSGIGGLPGFAFHPPLVSGPPALAGEFDASLLDLLAVEICEWTGVACVLPLVDRMTAQDRPPEQLRIAEDAQHYRALWTRNTDQLDPSKAYRIRVMASGQEIGHADLDVVANEAEPALDGDWVRVLKGSTLPIAFRIEKGLGERAGSAGGTITLADGQVNLELPEGALPNDVLITAVPASNLPPGGPPVVPGTAWDFGPDGLVFAEPVTLTIAYDPALLPPGTDESELRIHKLVNGTFVQLDAGVIDVVNNTASAPLDGFSILVLLERLFPGSVADLKPPVVQSIKVLDAATGTFGSAATLELGAGDANLMTRLTITDNGAGVFGVQVFYNSPTGHQARVPCWPLFTSGPARPPTTGNDTNGDWDCPTIWPQYSEAGTWTTATIQVRDKVGNFAFYAQRSNGFCDGFTVDANCLAERPLIQVNSDPADVVQPTVQSMEVSADVRPRVWGPSTTVDASVAGRPVVFGIRATDVLAGIGAYVDPDVFPFLTIRGPSGQQTSWGCPHNPVEGNRNGGLWECSVFMPRLAEEGTWQITRLTVPDRVGNGARLFNASFTLNATGQLCNQFGNCITPPTVVVSSAGDAEAPFLRSFSLTVNDDQVTMTLGVDDVLSDVTFVLITYRSQTAPNQFIECRATRIGGTPMNGTWQCSFTFSEHVARGEWRPQITLFDSANNLRFYTRAGAAGNGTLCYIDPAFGQVCEDFGETDIFFQQE